MKLYIWNDPYQVSYGGSLLYAVADSFESAKAQAASGKRYTFGSYAKDDNMESVAARLGEPTRIVELPCAEWYEWSE